MQNTDYTFSSSSVVCDRAGNAYLINCALFLCREWRTMILSRQYEIVPVHGLRPFPLALILLLDPIIASNSIVLTYLG
jgi:hypothetical protein